jgi:DNA-binding CsgD family transcriptional regulator
MMVSPQLRSRTGTARVGRRGRARLVGDAARRRPGRSPSAAWIGRHAAPGERERWPGPDASTVQAYRRALALLEEGRAWLDRALAGAAAADLPATPVEPAAPAGLSARELEVAALIARGKTSREIAEALVISIRTADTHATHIRDKLDLRSRAEIAAWAVGHGLLRDHAA